MPNKDMYLEDVISKEPALELLKSINPDRILPGYVYISPEDCMKQRGSAYNVILKDVLRGQLRKINRYNYAGAENEFSAPNIERAIEDLNEPLFDGLLTANERIYDALLLGKSYSETVGEGKMLTFNLRYIDWEHPDNNVLHITEEFFVESDDKMHNARPDIVLFINGIPFAVIECKSPTISVEQAVEQIIRNQRPEYIPQLFKFVQIVIATNKNTVKYATTGTPKKFWSIWKEDSDFTEYELNRFISGRLPTEQDKALISLLYPTRVLEFIKYFILFDAKVKKIARYQQYFAVQEILKKIQRIDENGRRQGGVVWHTQGSGKSLTMVMLAKYILMELQKYNPRVVVVTDRKELDRQITDTFSHTRLRPAQAVSGRNLVELISKGKADVITTIINKFNTAERLETKDYSKNIFLLVDESHRSNYGQFAAKMRTVFPNACYIGFTGTPLMKKEKNTMTKFGGLIHKYTIQDGVNDKAIVPLIYEGRFVEQHVDEENIDLWFEQMTNKLTELQKQDLKQKWSNIRRLTSTDARIKRIALDINNHFLLGYKDTGFKAMLATNYKRDAVRYLECFQQMGDLKCTVLISSPDIREGFEDIDDETDSKVIGYWHRMMHQYGSDDRYEEAIKDNFKNGDIDILIVCSKLLTGFDAPICQILYIDKELKEHGLLQAIARTNRIAEGKEYGLIVDYRGLVKNLNAAMDMYSGAGLEKFDKEDLKGVMTDIISEITKLRETYSQLEDLFICVKNKKDSEEIEIFLADDFRRKNFYNLLCNFGKALHIVINSEQAFSEIPRAELSKYKESFGFYEKLRRSIKIRYCDGIDNKEYEPLMQNLLDTHLSVVGLKKVTAPIDIMNKIEFEKELASLSSSRSRAEAISNRLTKSISEKYDENPAYYDSFSKRIKAALDEYKNKVISETEYLEKMRQIMGDYQAGKIEINYPDKIKNNVHAQAFYGVLGALFTKKRPDDDFIAQMAVDITEIFKKHCQVGYEHNITIQNRISQDIDDLFYEYEKQKGFKISFELVDKIIENVKTVALRRF
ncbi:MAG: type I restriction endonuclease subunit R [Spirochaetia bacterium]|nr:type I restriction endonuclease subunit R [Spirochaetia bacterium]